jgi:transcriptional regulator with XRE-family HTH domain
MTTDSVQAIPEPAGRVIPVWTIADKIRKVRRMAGQTQAEFAEAMRVGKAQLQGWESEHSRPSYQSLMLLAMMCEAQLGVPVDWIMEGDDRVTPESLAFARRAGAGLRHYAVTGDEQESEKYFGPAGEYAVRAEAVRHRGLEPRTRWFGGTQAAPERALTLVVSNLPTTPALRGYGWVPRVITGERAS